MSTLLVTDAQGRLAQELVDQNATTFKAAAGRREVPVDPELSRLLSKVLQAVARGGSVTIQTLPEELSTTVAAEQLGMSRPTLVKMIKDGKIPAHKVGSHHRVKLEDVRRFRKDRLDRQREAFEQLRDLEAGLESI